MAEPGGICISRVVRDQIRDKLPYPFEDMGEQSVKNIARPVRAYAMNAAAVAMTPPVGRIAPRPCPAQARGWLIIGRRHCCARHRHWRLGGLGPTEIHRMCRPRRLAANAQLRLPIAATPAPRLSIVVLPFVNLSNDPDQEYFADGITDDLTTDLSRISGSFVIARTTAFTYKGKPVDAKQIGRELGVRYVLEGSVRRAGHHVQVNVQLIDAESGAHLWADRFDTDRADLAKAQKEITGRLARSLNLELLEAESHRIEQERAVDPDARDFIMHGWAP